MAQRQADGAGALLEHLAQVGGVEERQGQQDRDEPNQREEQQREVVLTLALRGKDDENVAKNDLCK